jgi:rRNA maturation endonuclease Nob1
MTIAVRCTGCGKQFKAQAEHAGKKVRCPSCATPLTIPIPTETPAAAPSLGDLLDEELASAAKAQAAAATTNERKSSAKKCRQCGDELVAGSHFCLACGFNNRDVASAVANTAIAYDKRQQKIEALARPRHWLVQWLFSGWIR